MKALRTIAFLFLFSSTLVLGLHAGRTTAASLGPDRPDPTRVFTPVPASPEEVKIPGNGQRNLLVVGVDDLSSPEPRLESIWLVLYIHNYPQITLLPIFPEPTADIRPGELVSLEDVFRLNPGGLLDPAFLDALQARQLWWNAFLILDSTALDALVDQASPVLDERTGPQPTDNLPHAWEDPDAALASQHELAQILCQSVADFSSAAHNPLEAVSSDHFVTDLDLNEATQELQEILTHYQKLVCEFPTFSIPP